MGASGPFLLSKELKERLERQGVVLGRRRPRASHGKRGDALVELELDGAVGMDNGSANLDVDGAAEKLKPSVEHENTNSNPNDDD